MQVEVSLLPLHDRGILLEVYVDEITAAVQISFRLYNSKNDTSPFGVLADSRTGKLHHPQLGHENNVSR